MALLISDIFSRLRFTTNLCALLWKLFAHISTLQRTIALAVLLPPLLLKPTDATSEASFGQTILLQMTPQELNELHLKPSSNKTFQCFLDKRGRPQSLAIFDYSQIRSKRALNDPRALVLRTRGERRRGFRDVKRRLSLF